MDRLLDLMNRARAELQRARKFPGTFEQNIHSAYQYQEQYTWNLHLGYPDTDAHELALREVEKTIDAWYGLTVIEKPPIDLPMSRKTNLSLLRIENGRLRNDDKYFHWNGISEFYLPWYISRDMEVIHSRLDNCVINQRTGPRVLCMVSHTDMAYNCDFNILDIIYEECINRGLYMEPCLFADAHIIIPNFADRRALTIDFGQWCKDKFVLPQLCNEAFKNGFESAIDPRLIELSDVFTNSYGSRDFSITDSTDADDENAVEVEIQAYKELAKHSNILVLHPSRMRTNDPWRWINHLKGATNILEEAKSRSGNNNLYLVIDEPMGAASVNSSNRDSDSNHHIAANFVANCCGLGYTAHYIAEQDSNFPGLDVMKLSNKIKADPSFKFRNAGTVGSAVKSFTDYTKVRVCDNGQEAYAVGYGADGTMEWNGYQTESVIFGNEEVALFHATKV